jgi:anti-sigma factor RsiW
MPCEDTQTKLQEYLDGQLPLEEAQTVEVHLALCAACQGELALLRQVDDALATWPVLEEPADFTARVMAQVRATEQASPVLFPAFRLGWADALVSFAFACTVMAVLFVFSLLEPQHVSTARALLQRTWWAWLAELDRLWHTVEMEPGYATWVVSSLCVAAAAAASAAVLARQWQRRPVDTSQR